jgi:hypothetical protein
MNHRISTESTVAILHDDEIRRLCLEAGADDWVRSVFAAQSSRKTSTTLEARCMLSQGRHRWCLSPTDRGRQSHARRSRRPHSCTCQRDRTT